jgi:Holliday junction resolvase RusA-like endonuclease
MKIIYQYREELVEAAMASNIALPINYALEVEVLFVSPSSPDLDNLVMCFMRAMDGSSHSKITVLKDDGLIQSIKASKFFPR